MDFSETIRRGYEVSLRPIPEAQAAYYVTYRPRGLQAARGSGGAPKRVPEYQALASVRGNEIAVQWETLPPHPEEAREQLYEDVRGRIELLHPWYRRLVVLMTQVEAWASDLGWSVRRVEKRLGESEIGKYIVPALVMQRDMVKVGVEPIGRSAPGAEGVVDLYLLPAYDDMASLYYGDGRWTLHFIGWGAPSSGPISAKNFESKPLDRQSLGEVLDELAANVG